MDPSASIGEKIAAAADIALDVGTGINTRDIKAAKQAVQDLGERAKEIHRGLKHEKTRDKVTTAVVKAQDASGKKVKVVGSSEGRLRPGQREKLKQGDIELLQNGGRIRDIIQILRAKNHAAKSCLDL